MTSFFDLLVLAALFAPVALIVAGNLAAYRSPAAGEGLAGTYRPLVDVLPAADDEAGTPLPELRRAA